MAVFCFVSLGDIECWDLCRKPIRHEPSCHALLCRHSTCTNTKDVWVGINISGLEGPTIGYFSKLRKPCHTILVAGSKFLNQVFADNFSSIPFLTESLKKPGPRRI